jgi:hypothetical protein
MTTWLYPGISPLLVPPYCQWGDCLSPSVGWCRELGQLTWYVCHKHMRYWLRGCRDHGWEMRVEWIPDDGGY